MNNRLFYLTAPTLVALATMAACSTTPTPNGALEQVRARVQATQADTQVASLAPDELKRAGESLRVADKAWVEGGNPATINHLAYMTGQRVTIAQETAASLAAQAVTAGAGAERDRMRLAERTNEADRAKSDAEMAKAKLADAQQANAQKAAELAAADAAALRDKALLDRREARVSNLEMQLKDLNAKKTDRGIVVTLGDVLFDSGKAQLQPEASRNMGKLAEVFKADPARKASIEGYTDSVGSASSNQELSSRRAGAVMSALVGLGVPADRLTTRSHGEEMPVASNDTASGRQMNRRVEIVFTPQGDEATLKTQ